MSSQFDDRWEEQIKKGPQKLSKDKIEPKRLLNNAVAFREAGFRAKQTASLDINKGSTNWLGAPSVVNYSFAVEGYLKLLHPNY
jgi:hypothetical protein